jgi:lipopolysaccharide/colanic/teichoic acid biosynthesis glycosyltransferase
VLKGDMSLVGPRPQAPNEVALYTTIERRRLSVRPGLTGLWQVTARANPSFDEWTRWDLHYISNWSIGLDLAIIARTVWMVIGGVFGKRSSEVKP